MVALPAGFGPQEYLSLEHENAIRHEYRQGLVYAMAGGSDDHSRISINFLTALNIHLRDGDCQFFSGDVKVNYADTFFYYPDAFVTCDPRDRKDRYVKRYPRLITEVLSPSTADFDRGDKFKDYALLNSLEEYVLIDQDILKVECFRRIGDQQWDTVIYSIGEPITFKSIGLELPIEELYRGTSIA
ncbi:MAG: Uma2 family endonuclease [Cyanobacteria bacterium P01_A01_bin.137]